MAGITAVSATKTLDSGSTTADNTATGFVSKEQISLGLTGSPLSALWSLSKPNGSGSACRLDDESSLRPSFSPDVEGTFVASCLVDGATIYVLRFAIVNIATTSAISAIHFLPRSNSQIPTPSSGVTVFFSSDSGVMSQKSSAGTVTAL